ncbi:MAG: YchF/TatD family DNA exonuclease [Nitrospinota bacterium]|nr:YchF/TatD family DNA exonuclease [Nitrospinota bacterium]
MFADSHAHLNHKDYEGDIEIVADRLNRENFLVLNVAYDLESGEKAISLAHQYGFMKASVGVHPHDAESVTEADLKKLRELAKDRNVVAIGETGLDYFRNKSPRDSQEKILIEHLKVANENGKPVIIHCRDAFEEIVPILKEHFNPEYGGVLHCFSEGADEAKRGEDLGFYISFAGNVTYKKADKLREAAAVVTPERLLIETDAPYLAPQSQRGKRNEPLFLKETAKFLAELRGVTVSDIARLTNTNYRKLFLGVDKPDKAEIVYWIRDSLYVNVTRGCTNNCTFCNREEAPLVQGHFLGLDKDPEFDEIINSIGDSRPSELVFCGFGEPTMRLELVKKVASWAKGKNLKTRLNTNGHGNLIHGRDIVPELAGLIDVASISLNAHDSETYNRLCKPTIPEGCFEAVLDFIGRCKNILPDTVATAIGLPEPNREGFDLEKTRKLAEELGVRFRVRPFNMVGQG